MSIRCAMRRVAALRRLLGLGLSTAALVMAMTTSGCGEPDFSSDGDDGSVEIPDAGVAGPDPDNVASPTAAGPSEAEILAAHDLFPHASGSSWVMEQTSGTEKHRLEFTSLGERDLTDSKMYFVELKVDGVVLQTEGYTADKTGVSRVASGIDGSHRIDPPMPMASAPLVPGTSWTWTGTIAEGSKETSAEAASTLAAPEEVSVPAGKYLAYRLKQTFTIKAASAAESDAVVESELWLAPKVGLVKQITDDGVTKSTSVLVKYNPGSKVP